MFSIHDKDFLSTVVNIDKKIISDKTKSLSERLEKTANYLGRFIIIGRAVGPLRISYGAVKTAFCAVAAFFALLAAGLTSPSKNLRENCFESAKICANESLDGLRHIIRGVVESIPIFGNAVLYYYDFKKYSNSDDPIAKELVMECLKSERNKNEQAKELLDGANKLGLLGV